MEDKLIQLGIKAHRRISMHHTFLPRIIEVETTKACNLKCPGCRRNYVEGSISSEPGPKHLTVSALWRIIATTPCMAIRFEGDGEPLCNPYFKDLVKFLHNLGIRSVMTSNGTLLDKETIKFLYENGMGRIHVSFDGATKDTYEKIKFGADYEKTLYNCRLIGDSKIQLFMSIVLFTEGTIEELPAYITQAKSVKATGVHFMKVQADQPNFLMPDYPRYTDTIKRFREEGRKAGLLIVGSCSDTPTFTECYDPYINPFVLLNDDVYACTYMANLRRTEVYNGERFKTPYENYNMGNLNDNWMKDIWRNEAYKELRDVLKKTRRPTGDRISREDLLSAKKSFAHLEDANRFQYCVTCLCRWGETGL